MTIFKRGGAVRSWYAALALACLLAALSAPLGAQHAQHPAAAMDTMRRDTTAARAAQAMDMPAHDMAGMMDGPLGISHVRMGSGTSWMPDSSPMHATHAMWGDWTAMLHGVAFAQYDKQGSDRGDAQLGIVDWEMLMLMRPVGRGKLHLHGMVSLEPATIGGRGYPLLLQTGESYDGQPLHDRQHPHDFIMELAALFQQPIASNLAVELYAGPAGEPALGPVAFMHRPSAQNDPLSPLGHHWQDATHISYGVVTAGLYSRQWKAEGSWFNGREPDENRWNIDLRSPDSYSGRLTVNPTPRLSVAGWYGYLASPEALHPDESVHRYGASLQYGGRGIAGGAWGSTLLFGANAHAGRTQRSMLAETNLEIGRKNAVFGRAEYVRKSAEDLVLPGVDPAREFDVRSLVAGYVREVASIRGGTIGVGGRASVNLIPAELRPFYGTRTPAGIDLYVRVRPNRMETGGAMAGMPGMMQPGAPNDTRPWMPHEPPMRPDTSMAMPMKMPMPHDSAMMKMPHDSAMMKMPHDSAMKMPHEMAMPMPGIPMTKDAPAAAGHGAARHPAQAAPAPKRAPAATARTRKATAKTPAKTPRRRSRAGRRPHRWTPRCAGCRGCPA